jgi:hypothetical protein
LLCIVLLFFSIQLQAQTPSGSFQITENGMAENVGPYVAAIQNANFETYRLQNQRVSLSFDNGLTFELLSAAEMQQAGFEVSLSNYREANDPDYQAPILFLAPNGMIAAQYTDNHTKH